MTVPTFTLIFSSLVGLNVVFTLTSLSNRLKVSGVRVSFENVPLTRAFWVAENCKNDESPFHGTYCKVWKTSGTVGLLDGSVVSELCGV